MIKRIVSTSIMFLLALGFAHAQIIESILFAAGSSLLNRKLAEGDKRTISAIKPMCDIMIPDGKGGYRFSNTVWDPTTQTSVFMVDGLAFRVKSFKNGLPDRELKYYLNDALIATRRIEADKGFDRKKDGSKGQGVIGDYPIIDAKDICEGANQIKIVHNRQEIGSFTFVRIRSVRDVINMAGDAEMREKLYGFGGATFPSLPTYVAQMPDGSIRSFLSPEEMQLAFRPGQASLGGGTNGDTRNDSPPPPDDKKKPWNGEFRLGFLPSNATLDGDFERDLRTKGPRSGASLGADIPRGKKLAVLLTSNKPFGIALVDKDGTQTRAATRKGNGYELFIAIPMSDENPERGLVVSDETGKCVSILELKLKGSSE